MADFRAFSKSAHALDLAVSTSLSHFSLPIHVFRTLRPSLPINTLSPTPHHYPHDVLVYLSHHFHQLDKTATTSLDTIDKLVSRCLAPSAFQGLFKEAALRGK